MNRPTHRVGSPLAWVALLSLPLAALAEPCGGLALRGGQVVPATPLPARETTPDALACAKAIGAALKAQGGVRAVTVAVRLPDAQRIDGGGVSVGAAYEKALAAGGIPAARISTILPATPDAAASVLISFTVRRSKRPVAVIESASGTMRVGRTEASLAPAIVGQKLPVGMVVATGAGSAAWLALADGSRVRMTAETTLRLGRLKLGENLQRIVQLELITGDVEADVAPKATASTFRIRSSIGAAGVRGTHFRVAVVPKQYMRVETLVGLVDLSTDGGGVEVPGGHGSIATPDGPPTAARPLLPAPAVDGPLKGEVGTSERLRWEPVLRAAAYRVELALDAEFSLRLRTQATTESSIPQPADLGAGKWFWRVMAVDADHFVGLPSKVYAFVLKAD